jgi:SAM-dependent methyltransferase
MTQSGLATILQERQQNRLSAGMALMQLLLQHRDIEVVRRGLATAGTDPALAATAAELAALLEARLEGAQAAIAIAAEAELADRDATAPVEDGIERCRRLFDRAVGIDPLASVALYSFGTPELLAEATLEVATYLQELGIAAADRHLLDIGCGIGRFEQALAPHVGSVTGIDISPGMLEEARARCAGLANVRFQPTSGRDLQPFVDAGFDAVIAIDSFPYLYQAGGTAFVGAYLGEVARVLRPGGDVLVANLSYRGDLELDRSEARAFARALGLDLLCAGSADLRHWDGCTFHWRKPAQLAQDSRRP